MNPDDENLTVRPIAGPEELDLFCLLPYVLNDELADDLAVGRRRPEWMWVALRGGRLRARVAWWCPSGAERPALLDILDIDDGEPDPDGPDVAERLLRTAMRSVITDEARPPEYLRFVPPDWRAAAESRKVVQDRMSVLKRTGAAPFVERLRLEWRPGSPIPTPSGRLRFRQVEDGDEVVALLEAVLRGTLDAHSRDDLTRMTAHETAVKQYETEFDRYRSPREWWRVAERADGTPVGLVIPARNDYNPIIAYLAVLPEHRGNGYVDDVLAEGTRVLAAQDAPRIRASTDLGNTPMAHAFERAGYVNFERVINMAWDA